MTRKTLWLLLICLYAMPAYSVDVERFTIAAGGGSAGGHVAAAAATTSGFEEEDEDPGVG